MVDTVTTKVLHGGTRHYTIQITNRSDGTGESGVTKLDISTLIGPNGQAPSKVAIDQIKGSTNGMSVMLHWDRSSGNTTAAVVNGADICLDYRDVGGLNDPGSGNTGDLKVTTVGASTSDTYDLALYCRLID